MNYLLTMVLLTCAFSLGKLAALIPMGDNSPKVEVVLGLMAVELLFVDAFPKPPAHPTLKLKVVFCGVVVLIVALGVRLMILPVIFLAVAFVLLAIFNVLLIF